MKQIIIFASIILIAFVWKSDAISCWMIMPGDDSPMSMDCGPGFGSCMKTTCTGKKAVPACSAKQNDGCRTINNCYVCFCNTDNCNA